MYMPHLLRYLEKMTGISHKQKLSMELCNVCSLPFWVLICCLVVTVAAAQTPTQLKVFRGTLVHSRVRTEMEVLQDYLIGINESNYGTVSRGNLATLFKPQQIGSVR